MGGKKNKMIKFNHPSRERRREKEAFCTEWRSIGATGILTQGKLEGGPWVKRKIRQPDKKSFNHLIRKGIERTEED